jgi:hypothetical protein
MTDPAALRSELSHRLPAYLPPEAVAVVTDAAVQAVAGLHGLPSSHDNEDRFAAADAIVAAALDAVPPQYRPIVAAAGVVARAVQAWLDAPVQVQASSVTIRDERG